MTKLSIPLSLPSIYLMQIYLRAIDLPTQKFSTYFVHQREAVCVFVKVN